MTTRLLAIFLLCTCSLVSIGCGGNRSTPEAQDPTIDSAAEGTVAEEPPTEVAEAPSEDAPDDAASEPIEVLASDLLTIDVVPGMPFLVEGEWMDTKSLNEHLQAAARVNSFQPVVITIPANASITASRPALDAVQSAGMENVAIRRNGDR